MTKQELINLTNLENFADEFDKVESYVDSYLKTQLPNNYDDLKKHIKELRKMLVQLENNRAEGLKHLAFIGDSDDIPNKKAKLLKQMYLNKIDELEIEVQTRLDDYIQKQGKILSFISIEYLKSNHKTDKWKFPTSLGIEQVVDKTFETFVLNKIFEIKGEKVGLSDVDEAYTQVREQVLPIIKERILTYMGNVINDIGRDGAKLMNKSYVKKTTKPKATQEQQLNVMKDHSKIRGEYNKLHNKYNSKHCYEVLSKKYKLSVSTIKTIVYK